MVSHNPSYSLLPIVLTILFGNYCSIISVQAFQFTTAPFISTPLHPRSSPSTVAPRFSTAVQQQKLQATTATTTLSSDVVIVGGGPAGLLSAIMLAQKYPDHKIRVFDRLSTPPSPTDDSVWSDVAKFYLIGLGSRGQRALQEFGVWDKVKSVSTPVLGRKDWSPEANSEEGVERIFTDRPCTTQVLPRDKLVGVLYQYVLDHYSDQIDLQYNHDVTPLNFQSEDEDGGTVILSVSKCTPTEDDSTTTSRVNPTTTTGLKQEECNIEDTYTMSTNLLIAADGTGRTVANKMEADDKTKYDDMSIFPKLFAPKPFQVRRYIDDNQRIYKTVPMKIPQDWRFDLNYSARTQDGRVTFDALPADAQGNYCGVLLLKEGDVLAKPDSDPKLLRQLIDDTLPQFSVLVDDDTLHSIAKKPPSYLPSFRYAGPRLHQDASTLILGDCAHTVKPYFGLGANSALEDVSILKSVLDETTTTEEAVQRFSTRRAAESEALVKLSRELDRPGKLGFFSFILPLILDSIFHKLAPKIFAPNTIALLQREGITFQGVRRRKRMDRLTQTVCIGGVLTGITLAIQRLIRGLAVLTGKSGTAIATIVGGTLALALAFQKAKFFFNSGLAPADVLNKTKSDVMDNESFMVGSKSKR